MEGGTGGLSHGRILHGVGHAPILTRPGRIESQELEIKNHKTGIRNQERFRVDEAAGLIGRSPAVSRLVFPGYWSPAGASAASDSSSAGCGDLSPFRTQSASRCSNAGSRPME